MGRGGKVVGAGNEFQVFLFGVAGNCLTQNAEALLGGGGAGGNLTGNGSRSVGVNAALLVTQQGLFIVNGAFQGSAQQFGLLK